MSTAFDAEGFARQFQQFLESMEHLAGRPGREAFSSLLAAHLGEDPETLPPVRQEFAGWRWVDVDTALDGLDPGQRLHGVVPGDAEASLSDLLSNQYTAYALGAVERRALSAGPDQVRHVATNALRLLTVGDRPVVALAVASEHPEEVVAVEVLSGDEVLSREVLARIGGHVREHSALAGHVVSIVADPHGGGQGELRYHPRPRLTREDVVLPAGRLERIEAAVLGVSERAEALRAAGQHLSRGVLLYGPPGTGKTHTVRYLLAQVPDTSVILLNGDSLAHVRQAADAARALGRAIVVLEDADLVAADRDFSEGERSILFDVLDVLDGLDEDADVAFVLTTNRVGVLEQALALRPGRIDLAVEIPLPGLDLRRRLLARYGRDLPLTAEGLDAAAAASEGTTGSFPKEAVRRAVLSALAAGEEVSDAHLLAGVRELVAESAELREAMRRDAELADEGWDDEDDEGWDDEEEHEDR